MSVFAQAKSYLKHRLSSSNEHGVHSPFVFNLINHVIYSEQQYYDFEKLNSFFEKVRNNEQTIEIIDYGAGSKKNKNSFKKVGDVARVAGKNKKQGELLFKLANYFNPKKIIELGTSVGIGSAYMASALKKNELITIEGNPNLVMVAKKNFEHLGLNNIKCVEGNFDLKLAEILANTEQVDFVHFDGNHKKEPTLNYFNQCLNKHHSKTVFVFDDIHWSKEMEEAWKIIKQHPKVTVTVDLFYMGLVFFRPEQAKQHFNIRF